MVWSHKKCAAVAGITLFCLKLFLDVRALNERRPLETESTLSSVAVASTKPTKPVIRHQMRTIPRPSTPLSTQAALRGRRQAMLETDMLVLVLSRRSSFDTRQTIRETWGTASVRFVVGSCCMVPPSRVLEWTCTRDNAKAAPTANELGDTKTTCAAEDARLATEHWKFNDLIFAPTVDVYRHLPQKLKAGYAWTVANSTANWIVKTDDDSVVRINPLDAYLRTSYNATVPTVYGKIVNGKVERWGKWAEHTYKPTNYPFFPLGSFGHVVNRPVARWIVDNQDKLFNYQGEDVSVGIWLDSSPLKKDIQWIDCSEKHCAPHGDCFNTALFMIGHDISAAKMRKCFHATKNTVTVKPFGRLGNLMFEYASAYGIADQAGASFCSGRQNGEFSFNTLRETFTGPFAPDCSRRAETTLTETGYALHDTSLSARVKTLVGSVVEVAEYLQSAKYFDNAAAKIKKMFEFKPNILEKAQFALAKLRPNKQKLVGIHVRRGDYMSHGYLNFPPASYFEAAMAQFPNHKFVVVSTEVDWCRAQPFFANNADVVVLPSGRTGAVDMAILSLCDGIILTLGTFGWWAAWIAKDVRVVYYDNVFKLDHPTNKGKVRYEDHFLPGWAAVGGSTVKNGWSGYLPLKKKSSPHATFPRDCANPGPLPQGFNVVLPKNGHHNHGSVNVQDLYRIQVCMYATLDAFKTLANQHNIMRWALHAGSLIGAHCYSSMNPWDDDIDITVSRRSATAMQSMWNAAEPTTQHYHDTNWDQRYLLNRTFLLYKSRLGEREWYKLLATAQKVNMPSAVGLVGIDIHSNWPTERAYQRDSGFAAYLNSRQPMRIVEFGPTEANQMPESIVKRYLHQREWRCLS